MYPPDPNFDARQDAELRTVPLPDGLLRRLRRAALIDDEGLDAALREVPIPAGLTDRLPWVPLADDEGLDEAIRDVRVPVGVRGRLRRVPRNWFPLTRLTQWATAASLLIAIGVSYVGAMVAMLWATYQPDRVPGSRLAATAVEFSGSSEASLDSLTTTISPDFFRPDGDTIGSLPVPPFELQRFDDWQSDDSQLTDVQGLFGLWDEADPLLDIRPYRWPDVLGSRESPENEPEWNRARPFVSRGIRVPMVPGYPREFETRYGVHAFVSPALHSELQTSVVPLGTDTTSYELTRQYLEEDKLPPHDWLRTEEFLAAIDYEFPTPQKQALGVHVAGGPAPFSAGVLLMQVGVHARELRSDRRPAVRLTLAVDTSASMLRGGRLVMVRRALGKLAQQLGPDDRVSLIAFSKNARIVVENVGGDETDHLMAGIATLRPQSSTNVAAGLGLAYAVAQRTAADRETSNCVVLLTDGVSELDGRTRARIEQHLIEAAGNGLVLHVIDLAEDEELAGPDSQLAGFSLAGSGQLHRASSADQVGWMLREIITGQSQVVAAEARLEVSFNPKVVMFYRLLGHEAGEKEARPEADLYSGQSATAVYEIRLKPTATGDVTSGEVATAELTWRDPHDNQYHRASRKLHSKHFSSNLGDAPLSLQAAAVACEAAKVLRWSWFTPEWPKPGSLGRVLNMAKQLDGRLLERPTFVEFVSMLEEGAKVRP